MAVVNVVEKFGADDLLERSWELPDVVVDRLRDLVGVSAEGWIIHEWPITVEIAAIVQPFVDEPIDLGGDWFIGSWSVSDQTR